MSIANTQTHYGTVAKSFHWATVVFIITLIPSGIIANGLPYETSEQLAQKALLFSIHKTLGVTLFFVALARIVWAITQMKPGALTTHKPVEHYAAETVHWLLYGSLLLVPLSGWIHHAATTGFAPIWWPFGQNLPFVPKDEGVAATFAGLHIVFERVLVFSLLLHVAGALKHHFVDQDVTLRRMWFGGATHADTHAGHSRVTPFATAIAAWAAAVFIGGTLGIYSSHSNAAIAPQALAEVQSDWTVQEGTLTIKTNQFGQEVTGTFSEWTAAIDFDPAVQQGSAGSVEVTVAIGSLTLGSVTDQAFAPDYFDVATHPTATFTADITPITDGYLADGTLTLKGASIPVQLPFGLSVDGETASMTGSVIVDRRDFAIGMNMLDEGQLQFNVVIEVALMATRGAGE